MRLLKNRLIFCKISPNSYILTYSHDLRYLQGGCEGVQEEEEGVCEVSRESRRCTGNSKQNSHRRAEKSKGALYPEGTPHLRSKERTGE